MLGIRDASKWEQTTRANDSHLANSPIRLGINLSFWQKRKHVFTRWLYLFTGDLTFKNIKIEVRKLIFLTLWEKWLIPEKKRVQGSLFLIIT